MRVAGCAAGKAWAITAGVSILRKRQSLAWQPLLLQKLLLLVPPGSLSV